MTLTEREFEVLRLLKEGKTQADIAKALKITQPAVSSFKRNAERKIKEAEELVKKARSLGLLLFLLAFFFGSTALASANTPNPGHAVTNIGPGTNGTFSFGNYTFPANLTISSNLCLGGVCQASWPASGGSGNISGGESATLGNVAFFNNATMINGTSSLYWEAANSRLSIGGDATPTETLSVGANSEFYVSSTGYTRMPDGIVTLPALSFTSDTNTGLYRAGTDDLRFVTGGVDRLTINATGALAVRSLSAQNALTITNGSVMIVPGNGLVVGTLNFGGNNTVGDIVVSGKYAYIVEGGPLRNTNHNLTIVDIADPRNPRKISSIDIGQSWNLHESAGYVYVSSHGTNVSIYDVRNVSRPTLLNEIQLPATVQHVYAVASRLYVVGNTTAASPNATFYIIDVSNVTSPEITATVNLGAFGLGVAVGTIDVQNNIAYVTNVNTVNIIDVSNMQSPTILSNYSGPYPINIKVSGGYAYITGVFNTFTVLNVSNTSNPTASSSVSLTSATGVAISGKYAYVTTSASSTVIVYDVSNASAITQIGQISVGNSATVIKIQGKYLYVGGDSAGLRIIELPGIDAPTAKIGTIEAESVGITRQLTVEGTTSILTGLTVGGAGIRSHSDISVGGILYTPQLCLNDDCRTSWPAGTGNVTSGEGTTSGNLAFWSNGSMINGSGAVRYNLSSYELSVELLRASQSVVFEDTLQVTSDINAGSLEAPTICFGADCRTAWQPNVINGTLNAGYIPFATGANTLSWSPMYYNLTSGFMGIGTTNPVTDLDITGDLRADTISSTSTIYGSALVTNGTVSFLNNTGGYLARFNATGNTVAFGSSENNLTVRIHGNLEVSGDIDPNLGFDFAEGFMALEAMSPGDLVMAVDSNQVRKATIADADLVIGAVSTNPGIVVRDPSIENQVLVGLAGRIPVKVTGTIQRGDFITVSNTPGVGVAAREPSFVIGRAISDVRPDGTVMMIIQPSYFSPQVTADNELVGGKRGKVFDAGLAVREGEREDNNPPGLARGRDRVVELGATEDVVVTLG